MDVYRPRRLCRAPLPDRSPARLTPPVPSSPSKLGAESTAHDTYAHGYRVTLATDAMADGGAEAHRGSVERIFPRLGESGGTAEVLEPLAKTHG